METITLILKIVALIIIVSMAIAFLIFLVKIQITKTFYKNVAVDSLCSFYINQERYIGRIFDMEETNVKVEFIDIDNVINVKTLSISNIYPPA